MMQLIHDENANTGSLPAKTIYTSFRGRITAAQKSAIERYGHQYLITDLVKLEELARTTSRQKLNIEIGFGMGVELARWAIESPDALILGIELYRPGIGSLFSKLVNEGIENVRVIEAPAQIVIGELLNNSVEEIRILFPDPWPKKRHHKRRLIQKEFICQAERVLIKGGLLKIATDWKPYADWVLSCIEENTGFVKLVEEAALVRGERDRPTKFESRGINLKHKVFDFTYEKSS